MDRLMLAEKFARERHGDAVRAGGEPAVEHLRRVAAAVAAYGYPEDFVVVAWLHDVLEDTPTTLGEVQEVFGFDTARAVFELTDPSELVGFGWLWRKKRFLVLAQTWSQVARVVKCCDIIDNAATMDRDKPPEFVRKWEEHTSKLVNALYADWVLGSPKDDIASMRPWLDARRALGDLRKRLTEG